jgi:hypothetical protein
VVEEDGFIRGSSIFGGAVAAFPEVAEESSEPQPAIMVPSTTRRRRKNFMRFWS